MLIDQHPTLYSAMYKTYLQGSPVKLDNYILDQLTSETPGTKLIITQLLLNNMCLREILNTQDLTVKPQEHLLNDVLRELNHTKQALRNLETKISGLSNRVDSLTIQGSVPSTSAQTITSNIKRVLDVSSAAVPKSVQAKTYQSKTLPRPVSKTSLVKGFGMKRHITKDVVKFLGKDKKKEDVIQADEYFEGKT